MAIRLAIVGLEAIQRDWLDAAAALRDAGEVELVAVGHRTAALARDVADRFKTTGQSATAPTPPPAFDDLRAMLKETSPKVILLDRPANATLDFLTACVAQDVGLLSLGPPVESHAEAQALAAALGPRSRLLYIWPRFADSALLRQCAEADEFLRPVRFASGTWLGVHHALAKTLEGQAEPPVRSLSVLAWDALATIIRLMGVPAAVYATVRGTVGSGNSFADLTGAAALSLRFADDAAAAITVCDRMPTSDGPWNRRELTLWGSGGTLRVGSHAYEFRDANGKLIDAGGVKGKTVRAAEPQGAEVMETFREFLRQYGLPASPHRGWEHQLEEVAATMEALVVSHRTGQAESPDQLRRLRR